MPIETRSTRESLSPEDIVFYSFDTDAETRKLTGFCVIQLLELDGQTREVIKFDCAHGKCHVHRYYKFAEHKEGLGREISTETLYECIDDIMKNWQKYRGWYMKSFETRFNNI